MLGEAELYLLRNTVCSLSGGLQGQGWSRPPLNTFPQGRSCESEQLKAEQVFLIAGGKYHHSACSVKVRGVFQCGLSMACSVLAALL